MKREKIWAYKPSKKYKGKWHKGGSQPIKAKPLSKEEQIKLVVTEFLAARARGHDPYIAVDRLSVGRYELKTGTRQAEQIVHNETWNLMKTRQGPFQSI